MRKSILYLLLCVLPFASCIDEPPMAENTNTSNFEMLWKIIDNQYCYLDHKHINWDSIHTEYQAKVNDNLNEYELFDLMGKMLAELKDGHVNLYSDFNRSKYWEWFTDYPSNFDEKLLFKPKYLNDDYSSVNGLLYKKIDNGKIGYIYYGDFTAAFSDKNIDQIFKQFAGCEALIIDVRNNGGGALTLAEQFASYFFETKTKTGYIQHKTGTGHNDFSDPVALYTYAHPSIYWNKPVAILTNRLSYSATNNFVLRMKEAPNAIIVGDQTGGGGGIPLSSELPNGWMVRFSASPLLDLNLNHTELGIQPDISASLDATDQSNGIDSIIEKAIIELKKL